MNPEDDQPQWYAIHTRPKAEHIATAHLKQLTDMEVFCPRIRFQKNTRRGKVWFKEALFPGYTFACFSLRQWMRAVNATNAVLGVVRFGDYYPAVPESVIREWQKNVDSEAVVTIEEALQEGDEVEVVEGPVQGIRAIVTRVYPGQDRVRILMEMLGETREVEVSRDAVHRDRNIRLDSDAVSR